MRVMKVLKNSKNKERKVVLATKHQGGIRYGMLRGIQCSCMTLTSVHKDMGRLSLRLYNTGSGPFV